MVSEWAKKAECWEALRDTPLDLPDPLPVELQVQRARASAQGKRPAKAPASFPLGRAPASSAVLYASMAHLACFAEGLRSHPPMAYSPTVFAMPATFQWIAFDFAPH
jgi:hypothetical protein